MGDNFRRTPGTREGVNGSLDYGYAIVRSLVARCVVGVGLHPALGVHHRSRTNPLCLADDLVEPLRPLVDRIVASDRKRFDNGLDSSGKELLRRILDTPMACGSHTGPLTTSCEHYALSFRDFFLGDSQAIDFPVPTDE